MAEPSHTERLLLQTVNEVLEAHQTRDALATATLADLNSYTKRFTRLAGPKSGEVDLDAVLHHFDSELLTGQALQRVLEHVGVADVTLVTKGQFLAVAHLVFTVLQRVQERMFEGAGLCSPSPGKSGVTGFASPSSQHSWARSVNGVEPWSIQAGRGTRRPGQSGPGGAGGHRRHVHPTVAQLLSLAVGAQEESMGGSTPALSVGSAAEVGGEDGAPTPMNAGFNDWQAFSSSSGDVSSASLDWATGLDAMASPVSSRLPSPGTAGQADLWDAMLDRPRGVQLCEGEVKLGAKLSEGDPTPAEDWQAFTTGSPAKLMLQGLTRDSRSAPSSARLIVRRPGLVAGLEPMSAEDRQRCEQLYEKKKYAERGGLKRSSAWRLFGKSGIEASPFEQAWRLAGGENASLQALDCQQFCLLVHLLHCIQRGAMLPSLLSNEAAMALLGQDAAHAEKLHLDLGRLRLGSQQAESQPATPNSSACKSMAAAVGVHVAPHAMPPPAARVAKAVSTQETVPRPLAKPGVELVGGQHHRLEVELQLARFQYRKSLDRPFITMSLRDGAGRFLELPRDSHPGRYSRLANTVVFSQSLEVETPLGRLPPGACLYFELRHWKGREARFSTLAWTAVPAERVLDAGPRSCRVREGVTALPLYRKPLEVCVQRARRLPGEHSTLQVALKQVTHDPPAALNTAA